MSNRLDQHPRDGQFLDEGVIDLEPTVTLETADPSLGPPVALAQGTMASLGGELDVLRRSRLTSVAIFLSIVSLVIFVFNRVAGVSTQWLIPVLMGLRVIHTGAVAGLLISKVSLSRNQIRILEFVLFGGLTLLMCVGQYFVTQGFIEAQNVAGLIAYEKNNVLQLFALMVLYGMFIPNDAKSTARVVLTMALLPGLALALSLEHQDAEPMIEKLKTIEPLGAGLVSVLIGASLAIYGAHVLNGLRVQLHEAKKFGQYKLVHKLGSGGMGDVYLAEHELLKRPCALKLIRSDVGAEPLAIARFEREVRSAARLSHPNTIEIFDYGHTDDGTFYYVMEYLQGLSLNELVSMAGPLPPGRVIYLFRQICAGLAEAHSLGLVHRDLKPANIYVAIRGGESDVAKVLDFGLVKVTQGPDSAELTSDQSVSGTPMFMAPEQAAGDRELDARADIYALGAIAYYCLTGQAPFSGNSPFAIMIAHARDPVVPPSQVRPEIPADLEAIILRCLAKKREDRYADVKALGKDLAACAAAHDWDGERADEWWISTTKAKVEPATT